MAKYRTNLPQLTGDLYLTDGGLETTLIFHKGIDLRFFAAFDLLKNDTGIDVLKDYFRTYARIAKNLGLGLILESATWRANRVWAEKMGYSREDLNQTNLSSISLLEDIRNEFENDIANIVISGCIGPRGDGYEAGEMMSPAEAEEYHGDQIRSFARSQADMITAITMTYENEAIGIVNLAARTGMPVAISFTVETDGRLPNGRSLKDAIEFVDSNAAAAPAYYMVNCAHPTHFSEVLAGGGDWTKRIRGTRVNASKMSHQELDEAEELDAGDPEELASDHSVLRERLPDLTVFGGCCGTDHRHVEKIARLFTSDRNAAHR